MFLPQAKITNLPSSTKFMKAIVEVGYNKELYNAGQYEGLEKAIEQVSHELMQQVFN